MKDNGWSVGVEYFGSEQPRVVIRVSKKYAQMLVDRHPNVTNFVMEKVGSALGFIAEKEKPVKCEASPFDVLANSRKYE